MKQLSTERLNDIKNEVYEAFQISEMGDRVGIDEFGADIISLIDAEINRCAATRKEIEEAIKYVKGTIDIRETLNGMFNLPDLDSGKLELAISALNQMQGWISVEERLPKEDGFYLVTVEEETGELRWKDIGYFEKYAWQDEEYDAHVTHWMPLPDMPKE